MASNPDNDTYSRGFSPIEEPIVASHDDGPVQDHQDDGMGNNSTMDHEGFHGQPHKQRPIRYTYHHTDTDITVHELEEFFSYVEVPPVVIDSKHAWERAELDWFASSGEEKTSFLVTTLELLEHPDAIRRLEATRRLCYVALGIPLHTNPESPVPSTESHLATITKNCQLLRDAGAMQASFTALKNAGRHWLQISTGESYGSSEEDRQTLLDDLNTEIGLHLCTLYFMVEILRGDSLFVEEMMSMDPPLPIYLFGVVASLREVNAKGYPVKKLLLLLWKSLLASFGGSKDIKRVKKLVREIEGFNDAEESSDEEDRFYTKASPMDLQNFINEATSKYPTYRPPVFEAPISSISLDRIVAAAAPAPVYPSYSYQSSAALGEHRTDGEQNDASKHAGMQGNNTVAPFNSTPAPSPPASPAAKVKKTYFQTDQSKPYILPFSKANALDTQLFAVPRAIAEAGELYKRNIRMSTELWQTLKIREELREDESGVRHVNKQDSSTDFLWEEDPHEETSKDPNRDSLKMLQDLVDKTRQEAKATPDPKKAALLEKRASDLRRLERVELFYRATLSHLHSAIIVLLKLMLASVTASTNFNNNENDCNPDDIMNNTPTLETIDIMRHREITSKAVSAILILLLRWYKVSHAMKFHYFSQLLVDYNCLLLILKIFGLRETSTMVNSKYDVEQYNFFKWCTLTMKGESAPSPHDISQDADILHHQQFGQEHDDSPEGLHPIDASSNSKDVELINEYSWRSFFSTINFVHILQKLTKRRVQRILLLVQYKSAAILKRILRVSHPLLQLYVLKVIKSQIPYAGRRWRQSSMKVITAIYLNCRPSLRDDWLTCTDVENDIEESMPNEQNLRTLVKFYNTKHYGPYAPYLHRRSSSTISRRSASAHGQGNYGRQSFSGGNRPRTLSNVGEPGSIEGSAGSPISGGNMFEQQRNSMGEGNNTEAVNRTANLPPTFEESSSFPPVRPITTFGSDRHLSTSYIPDTFMDGYLENYEEILGDIFTPHYPVVNGSQSLYPSGDQYMSASAWDKLGDILGPNFDVSDTESVGTIGYLEISESEDDGDDDQISLEEDQEEDEGKTNWEHLSPRTMTALEEERAAQRGPPGSPLSPSRPRRRSSSDRSPALRPVIPLNFNDSGLDADVEESSESENENEQDVGPAPTAPHTGPAVDEVEAIFGS